MFEKAKAKLILDDIQAALKGVEEKHGVTLRTGSTSLGMDDMTTKITLTEGANVDLAKKEWDTHCTSFGLSPEDFGQTFIHRGKEFTICGIKPRSPKYPIIGESAGGSKYKFQAESVMLSKII